MRIEAGNLNAGLPAHALADEVVDRLLDRPPLRIERIVSTGQATPEGEWYDQDRDEWVLLAAGSARLRIEGEDADRELCAGDWLLIPARCRHRVTWTQSEPPTVWLAIHF
ncbi:MAG: cupin domain-containing protein [Methyloceanibacter sp.]